MLAPSWDINTRNVSDVPREYTDDTNTFFNLAVFASTASGAKSLTAAACTPTGGGTVPG